MRTREQKRFIVVYLAPAFVLFTVFVAIPGARALLYSLQNWNGMSEPTWAGLSNFVKVFKDTGLFWPALWHNVLITVFGGSLTLALALVFASMLSRRVRGAALFRAAFFFPNVLSSVAITVLWILLYSTTDFGVINGFLGWIEHGAHALGWTSLDLGLPFPFVSSRFIVYSVIPMAIWTATGFYMVLFLAAMDNIPESFYEAAKLDGASGITQFWHITLPLIREVIVVGAVFLVIGYLKFFDAIWIMESQWPAKESHVLATVLYQKSFSEYNFGYGSAVAVVLFVLVFTATLVTLRFSRKEALEY
jgi:ABC-type sugar transport system permease subunit